MLFVTYDVTPNVIFSLRRYVLCYLWPITLRLMLFEGYDFVYNLICSLRRYF